MGKKSKGFVELLRQQQREKNHQDAMQGLEDTVRQGPLGKNFVDIVKNPKGHVKMSDVLERFVEPYEDDEMTLHHRRNLLGIAVIAWNLALLPQAERKGMMKKLMREVLRGDDPLLQREARSIVENMIARKEQLFADNQRYIVSYDLKDMGTEFHLTVASTLPGQPATE